MIKAQTISALQELLSKAKIKANLINPETIQVEQNFYRVKGSKGNFYDCFLGVNPEGEFWVACTCRAGLEGRGCYHASKALERHLEDLFKAQRLSERDKDVPYFKTGSDKQSERIGGIKI